MKRDHPSHSHHASLPNRFAQRICIALLLTLAAGAWLLSQPPAHASRDASHIDPGIELSPTQVDLIWRRNWPLYARSCIVFEGDYAFCPGYSPQTPSSLGKTARQLIAESSREVRVRDGVLIRSRTITMPREEAEALANALPRLEVGAYGYIHSMRVDEILGPEEMIVSDIWLIDEEDLQRQIDADERVMQRARMDAAEQDRQIELRYGQRRKLVETQDERDFAQPVRLVGVNTRTVREKQRYTPPAGLQIALVKRDPPESRRREGRLVATPATQFGRGVSEAQFLEMLTARDYTQASFAALISHELQQGEDGLMQRVFAALEAAAQEIAEYQAAREQAQQDAAGRR